MSIYQVVLNGQIGSGPFVNNVHHYEFPGYIPDATEIQEFVDNVDAAYKSNLQGYFWENLHFQSYTIRRVDVGDLPGADFVPTAGAWDGSNSGAKMPNQLCALVTWKGITVFPRTTRSYMFPFTEAHNESGGTIAAALVSDLEQFASDMVTIDVTGQANPYKVAVKYGGDPRAVTDANITYLPVVTSTWRTQRRRVAGFGS